MPEARLILNEIPTSLNNLIGQKTTKTEVCKKDRRPGMGQYPNNNSVDSLISVSPKSCQKAQRFGAFASGRCYINVRVFELTLFSCRESFPAPCFVSASSTLLSTALEGAISYKHDKPRRWEGPRSSLWKKLYTRSFQKCR